MRYFNIINLLRNKKNKFFIIFIILIGVYIYRMYTNNINTLIIEQFNMNDSDLNKSKLSDIISNFFKQDCLTGCVAPTSNIKSDCEKIYDDENNYHYECAWKCDNNKFDDFLDNNVNLKNKLKNYKRCSTENEIKDCGACRPKRSFYN